MSTPTLRPVTEQDAPFLLSLYAETRAVEMAMVPWTDDQKHGFVEAQFNAQNEHYREHFPDATFDVIVSEGQSVGRLYVLRNAEQIRILDIHVQDPDRAKGVGGYFIDALTAESHAANKPLRIYLEINNPYMPAFERRGFVSIDTLDGFYVLMECRAAK